MANEEHVALLELGSVAWNPWRGENPREEPDLNAANLPHYLPR
jgi:hypothetical protein